MTFPYQMLARRLRSARRLQNRRSDGRVGLHTAESRARHRWVAAEALTLLLERYASHLTRGCTSDRCVDNSITLVCADSLTCPVCTLTSPTAKPVNNKVFFTADLAPFFTSIAQQHGKLDVNSWKVMLRLPRVDPSIESFTPRLHYARLGLGGEGSVR